MWEGVCVCVCVCVPSFVKVIGPAPHDWLFPRMQCVVHHGGAGTMSQGLLCGKVCVCVCVGVGVGGEREGAEEEERGGGGV